MHRSDVALLAAIALIACADATPPADRDVPVDVDAVVVDERHTPVVLLEERDGPRTLPIWIGGAEATSIARQLSAIPGPRPNTHDMATRLVEALDGRVERMVVSSLEGGTYFGLLTVRSADGVRVIDVRPSDGIAMALRADAPLFVRESVLDSAGETHDEEPEKTPPADPLPEGIDPATSGRSI